MSDQLLRLTANRRGKENEGQKKKKRSRMAVLPVEPVGNCVVVAICAAKTKKKKQ